MSAIALGVAERMPGAPRTETGLDMPLASWFHLTPAFNGTEFVVVTLHGVYQSDPLGRIHDFFTCLYERPAVDTPADALHHLGAGYELAEVQR